MQDFQQRLLSHSNNVSNSLLLLSLLRFSFLLLLD